MIKILNFTLILFIIFSAFLVADEEADNNEVATEKEQKDEVRDEATLEEFVPSEEVSIDKPVAFPVDI